MFLSLLTNFLTHYFVASSQICLYASMRLSRQLITINTNVQLQLSIIHIVLPVALSESNANMIPGISNGNSQGSDPYTERTRDRVGVAFSFFRTYGYTSAYRLKLSGFINFLFPGFAKS